MHAQQNIRVCSVSVLPIYLFIAYLFVVYFNEAKLQKLLPNIRLYRILPGGTEKEL
jgi:hypothetical protein